jgi:hypothetical protein
MDTVCPRRNHIMARGCSGDSGHDDGSTVGAGTAAGHRPPF